MRVMNLGLGVGEIWVKILHPLFIMDTTWESWVTSPSPLSSSIYVNGDWVTPKPFEHQKEKLEGREKVTSQSKVLTMSGPLLFSRYLFWKKM